MQRPEEPEAWEAWEAWEELEPAWYPVWPGSQAQGRRGSEVFQEQGAQRQLQRPRPPPRPPSTALEEQEGWEAEASQALAESPVSAESLVLEE